MSIAVRIPRLSAIQARTYLLVMAIVVLLLALSEIFEVVELPFESLVGNPFTSSSVSSVQLVTSSMSSFGYLGLFALMFLESASLPIPSEVILPFAGYLVFAQRMNFEAALAVGTVAGVAGALVDYYLALELGRPTVQRIFKWVGVSSEHLDRAEWWLGTKGAWSILVARFVPGLRSIVSLPAGAVRMRLTTFSVMTAVGALGWTALLVYLGYSAGDLWQSALSNSAPVLTEIGLGTMVIASVSYIVYFLESQPVKARGSQ